MEEAEPRLGRPRDPAVDQRALEVALELYGQSGWAGLSFGAVATRAKVGKSALYRRWPGGKGELLVEALSSATPTIKTDPTLEPRELLLDIGSQMLAGFTGRWGPAMMRIVLERDQLPEYFAPLRRQMIGEIHTHVAAMDRAVTAGRLRLDGEPSTLLEMLAGAVVLRAFFTVDMHEPGMQDDPEAFLAEVVDVLLAGRLVEDVSDDSRGRRPTWR